MLRGHCAENAPRTEHSVLLFSYLRYLCSFYLLQPLLKPHAVVQDIYDLRCNIILDSIYSITVMAGFPRLDVNHLPSASAEEAVATQSPARGKEMRANLLSKLRAPPLVHSWDFYHDRQTRTKDKASSIETNVEVNQESSADDGKYEDRLVHLAEVGDVRAFWNLFNNFDISTLQLRDSVHLFHRGVKPVWEDPRNVRGGAWTFRVPKDKAQDFWKEMCLLAIGERLQAAVASQRKTFIDDICGVSLSVRFTSILVQIWNRDAGHADGVARILSTVLEGISPELKPKEGSYYYKPHQEHAGFDASAAPRSKAVPV